MFTADDLVVPSTVAEAKACNVKDTTKEGATSMVSEDKQQTHLQ